MPERTIAVIRQGFDDSQGFDTGVSEALLRRVGEGSLIETFRVSTPGNVVAFGKQDRITPGFDRATELARRHGFASVIRLPGGRAAVFHDQVISFSWTIPNADPIRGIRERFDQTAALVVDALASVGVEASVGEIPGEYCPGEFSVSNAGSIKLAGIGQRLTKRAAHVGGVLVVGGADRIREVLVPVYGALGIDWDPSTVGAIDNVISRIDVSTVVDALLGALSASASTTESALDQETLDFARTLAPTHKP
ncbi:MAG: lipoate--protein ligase family protein [Acidimicrobiia bacterium]